MRRTGLILAGCWALASLRAEEPPPVPLPPEGVEEAPAEAVPEPPGPVYDPVQAISGEREQKLFQAAQAGDAKTVAQVLAAGRVNVDVAEPQGGATPLQAAALFGHLEVVRQLVGAGADMDRTDREGRSALALATRGVHVAVMEFLLKHGAHANLAAHDGTTPLHDAVTQNHYQEVELLVQHGACATCGDARGVSPLDLAKQAGRPALVRAMGHDPAKGLFLRERLLRKAAIAGDEAEVARLLKDPQLDVNFAYPEANDWTALHEAANYGHLPIVEQLVDAGADVDQRDRAGKTPLYLAVELRHPQMVALLLGKGADPGKADQRGISPLAYARENGLTALVNLMQQHLGPGRAPVRRQPSPAARP